MEGFVTPFNGSYTQLMEALLNTPGELGLAAQIHHWQLAWLNVSIVPHIEVHISIWQPNRQRHDVEVAVLQAHQNTSPCSRATKRVVVVHGADH